MGVVTTYDEYRNDLRNDLSDCLRKAKKLLDEDIWGHSDMKDGYDVELYLAIKKVRDLV